MKFENESTEVLSYCSVADWRAFGICAGFGDRTFDTKQIKPGFSGTIFGRNLLLLHQVHGVEIVDFSLNETALIRSNSRLAVDTKEADAWLVDLSTHSASEYVFGIRTADCVPVIVASPAQRVVALCHCGWRGAVGGLLPKVLTRFKTLSATDSISVAIGPCAQVCCYEVGKEVAQDIEHAWNSISTVPCAAVQKQGDKFFANLSVLLIEQAIFSGISRETIGNVGACTICEKKYFSYRRDGQLAGRQLTFCYLNH